MATDTVIVLNVIHGGPSDKAGVKAGDRIVRIGRPMSRRSILVPSFAVRYAATGRS